MFVYFVYLLCIYKSTHIQYIYFENFTCIYLYSDNLLYINIFNIQIYVLKFLHACVCIYIYIYIYIYNIHICERKLLFWMRLIKINHLTALI